MNNEEKVIAHERLLGMMEYAAALIKEAGFQLHQPSMKSESCYYYHPLCNRKYLLRLSTHSSKKIPKAMRYEIRGNITVADTRMGRTSLVSQIAIGIGFFFMNQAEEPSHPCCKSRNRTFKKFVKRKSTKENERWDKMVDV